MTTTQPILTPIEYARFDGGIPAEARPAVAGIMYVSILSGLCVGVCFIAFTGVPGAILHLGLFAATIVLAINTGRRMPVLVPVQPLRMTFDTIAAVGLCIMAVLPILYQIVGDETAEKEQTLSMGLIGLAFLLQACTTWRHRMLYRELARSCRGVQRNGLAKTFTALGHIKTWYEGLWLACCAAAPFMLAARPFIGGNSADMAILPAFGAFFGCFGFGIIWIAMIIAHARLLTLVDRGTN